jgi:hypothetical protein
MKTALQLLQDTGIQRTNTIIIGCYEKSLPAHNNKEVLSFSCFLVVFEIEEGSKKTSHEL